MTRPAARGRGAPLEEQRELDVLEDAEDADQVEALEDEADGVEPEPGQLALAEAAVSCPRRATVPRVATSTQPMRLRRVVFPLPRAGDGDELARVDVERHAPEGRDHGGPELVLLHHVDDADDAGHLTVAPRAGVTCYSERDVSAYNERPGGGPRSSRVSRAGR
jgi:hypothetical protein